MRNLSDQRRQKEEEGEKFFFTPTSLVFSLLALHYEKLV